MRFLLCLPAFTLLNFSAFTTQVLYAKSFETVPSSYSESLSVPKDEVAGIQKRSVQDDANALFDEYWQQVLKWDPEAATLLGKNLYNDKLAICNPQCFEKKKVALQDYIKRANQLLLQASSGSSAYNNLQVFTIQLGYQVDLIEIGNHLLAISYLSGPQTDLFFLLDEIKLKSVKDCEDLISRYRAFPQQVQAKIELLNEGIRRGITQHEKSLRNLEKTFLSFDVDAEESPFYEPFKKLAENVGTAEEIAKIRTNAKEAVTGSIIPGFKRLAEYFKDVYRSHARKGVGVSSMTGGNEFYRKILNSHVTDNVKAEDIHNLGIREVARIKGEMEAVINGLGLKLTPKEFNEVLRNNATLFFSTRAEAIGTYRDYLEHIITPKLPNIFKNIPKEKLAIKEAPDYMAGGPMAYYMPGTDTTPGTFFLDTSNLKNLPKYETVTLSLHEGVPGHHLQIAYAKERTDLPDFRRFLTGGENNAFIEGWALYAEYLGYELELFSDKLMLYGHLSDEIFRACRLVVDTGMHALGWSRQDAIDYMAANSASTIGNIENEVDRYITWPGQACSYKFGETKIKEFRKKAHKSLGSKFDVKDFHDVILRNNGPMLCVEQEVNRYIKQASSS